MNGQTEELYQACATGDPAEVKEALAKAPDVNSREFGSGFTPLHVCVSGTYRQEDRKEVIRLLHQAGANLEVKDGEKGLTPLHYAGLRNKPLCAQALLECGADVHATEANGATALHGAAFHGNVDVAKVLLAHGADSSKPDLHGNTPLALAQRCGHDQLVALLSTPAKPLRPAAPKPSPGQKKEAPKPKPSATSKSWWRFW